MKRAILLITFCFAGHLAAQQVNVSGDVIDDQGNLLSYASVAFLFPEDSTLAFFATTNADGHFEIRNVAAGDFTLQCALLGYQTVYKIVKLVNGNNTIETLIMQRAPVLLGNVNITSERIPVLIKNDTVEYDAGAYKTKPDAVAEDLLKKLPGVQVDREGNIKAEGEDVKQVLVDGKQFFGTDLKVATKNLPADAIKKVQVFDKKSDEAEFTGIDDGSRSKTINLLLKDNQKSAYFGDVRAGDGTGYHFQTDARLYRFTKKSQFAALAMLNNINQFGFTFRDYIDFNGGIGSLANGEGRVSIGDDETDLPVNFGQPVTGLMTSGAGGINYSYEPKKGNRFNISYLGDGISKDLHQDIFSKNFTGTDMFVLNKDNDEKSTLFNHRISLALELRSDSSEKLIVNGSGQLNDTKGSGNSFTQNSSDDSLLNSLSSISNGNNHRITATGTATYLKKLYSKWRLLKLSTNVMMKQTLAKTEWNNITELFSTGSEITDRQFQNNETNLSKYSLTASMMRKIMLDNYLIPEINASLVTEWLNRKQGIPPGEENIIDSLNAQFMRGYHYLRPGISFRKSDKKRQLSISAYFESGKMNNVLMNKEPVSKNVNYLLPQASGEFQYKTGSRLAAFYESRVNTPNANQLLPLINNINPLLLFFGNRFLLPEYEHGLHFNWMQFDEFSFTSFFAGLNATYTHDKINWSRTINKDLLQQLTLLNVPYNYSASANFEFSSPVRKLGISVNLRSNEKWNRGINYVNGIQNINTNLDHKFTVSIDNRKKDKWDVNAGAGIQLSNAKYSVASSLNNNYFNISCFTDINYTPNSHWNFTLKADITQYNAYSFNQSVTIPLLSTEFTRYILKHNRASVTLSSFDLLNRNTGIERISELNYLQETKSNIIRRYFMLSFKFRLDKFDDSTGGVNVEINKR